MWNDNDDKVCYFSDADVTMTTKKTMTTYKNIILKILDVVHVNNTIIQYKTGYIIQRM